MLYAEQRRLEKIVRETRDRLKNAPEGTLRMSRSHNKQQYYRCTAERKAGEYINKGNMELIRQLAQKAYDEKVIKFAEKRLLQIQKLAKNYKDNEIEQIYRNERIERQVLINPVEPTWEQRVKEWKEKIMADYFYRNGIEYKYECPLYLKGVGTIYPDFTFLSPKTGEEIYWEHNGMVDNPEYTRKMVRKIQAYENNGIFPGERLILTFETEQSVLSTNQIEQMVKRYLKQN